MGFQCPECLAKGAKAVRQPRTVAGGAIPGREGAATMSLIGINVVVYLLSTLPALRELEIYGSLIGQPVIYDGVVVEGVSGGEYWRLLTSAFLHAGFLHLAFNMLGLYFFGAFLENILGTARFVAFYLASAVFSGAVVYLLSDPRSVTVGASGAVFALLGLALVMLLKARQDVRTLVVLIAINAVLSLRDGISWQGHLGGFVAGVLFGLALSVAPRGKGAIAQTIGVVLLVVLAVAIAVLRTLSLDI
ncbi:rhomboid family intramembrane serine protease [Aeromicrobium sp. Leaf350]|uniref:rhomboid family intramembrane serine protease n=1 Tax=Aeromicrobium sp. Leaf350 TaxID=2876565 RepID=UPI001E446507|nr:rhomboid family intramembrane serine protease [Aeromicrobium sp. Leaf350]